MPFDAISREWGKGMSKSTKSGLIFPVSRTRRYMKQGRYAKIIQQGAAVYLAAVLEYLVCEMVELSGNAARDNKKSRINPRFLKLAVSNDQELDQLLGKVICPQSGVKPGIHPALLPSQNSQSNPQGSKGGGKKGNVSVEMNRSKSKFKSKSKRSDRAGSSEDVSESL